MGDSKSYLAPLGLAAIGALFGIGHFGGLHDTFFGSDNETEITTSSYYSGSESTGYGSDISFRGASNNGTYSKTGNSVLVYSENGNPKGSYAVYIHHGNRYIDFNNTWICIQGKSRFGYCGNWYVIK